MALGIQSTPFDLPGIGAALLSDEKVIWWGNQYLQVVDASAVMDSTTIDASQTPTTKLQSGLTLGIITATNKWVHYDDAAIDGSEVAKGFLLRQVNMLDVDGVAEDKQGQILIQGLVRVPQLSGLDAAARVDLIHRFFFDDDLG